MTVRLVIAARRFSANGIVKLEKGDIVSIVPDGGVFGSKEVPPDFVRLEISDATFNEALHYIQNWTVDYEHTLVSQNATGWRYRIEVDPQYVDVSSRSKQAIKQAMLDHIDGAATGSLWDGSAIVSFSQIEMVVDIPKQGVYETANSLTKSQYLQALKADFSDIFSEGFAWKRYHFSEADVDAAVALPNGQVTGTKAQVLNKLVDKLGE